jgi:transcriptional regulator, propionate catabolism operon regulatory protein
VQALVQAAGTYDWPGNVRELENLLERLLAYAGDEPGEAPRVQSLPERLRLIAPELFEGTTPSAVPADRPHGAVQALASSTLDADWRRQQALHEAEHLQQVLAACGGDRQRAADALGISRTTLWRKLKAVARP